MGVTLELVVSGLCLLSVSNEAFQQGPSAKGDAEILCAEAQGHLPRMTVSAKHQRINVTPSGATSLWDWFVGPDGTEYASLALEDYVVDIQETASQQDPDIDWMYPLRDAGPTALYAPASSTTLAQGTSTRIRLPIGGKLSAQPRIRDHQGDIVPWCQGTKDYPQLTDDLLWKGTIEKREVELVFYREGLKRFTVTIEPYYSNQDTVKIGFAADVQKVEGPKHPTFQLGHLYHMNGMVERGAVSEVPKVGGCAALSASQKMDPRHQILILTSQPICNVPVWVP